MTRRAERRFARREWREGQQDAAERLALYRAHVDEAIAAVERSLGDALRDRELWREVRDDYATLAESRGDSELAETFFNSVTRRVFTTVGVDPSVEFVDPDIWEPDDAEFSAVCRSLPVGEGALALANAALDGYRGPAPFADRARDVSLVADAIGRGAQESLGGWPDGAALLDTVFYRNKGAYLVGRMQRGETRCPLVIALLHGPEGVTADAVLTMADEASIVFGFSWSYFHVVTARPRALVRFLASVMPLKRIDELYASVGFHKHAKTELYRELLAHLAQPDAQFARAEGARGLVMEVFTLPSFNVVFKVIKDRFGAPKRTTRREVMEKYGFVFVRDRVGRLADAQEFEHLELPRRCFPDALLAELQASIPSMIWSDDERVVVRHLYTQRRLVPLNLYLRDTPLDAAVDAIVEYGQAIKDLAAANIFTGDMLLKNFGVSRHGRVIFYDYDEVDTVLDCEFREIPPSRDTDDDYSAEPWFAVGDRDVFPEEFSKFLVPEGALHDAFVAAHDELLHADWWREVQQRLAAGELVDVFPYRQQRRLRSAWAPSDESNAVGQESAATEQ